MNRRIRFITSDSFNWIISIDEKTLRLGKYRCIIDFGNEEAVIAVLKEIEDTFIWNLNFCDVQKKINTFNLLTILDALYYDNTLEWFRHQCFEIMKIQNISFKNIFRATFYVTPQMKYECLCIIRGIYQIYKEVHFQYYGPKKIRDTTYAYNENYSVKYVATISNVASFTINGESFDICLSKRKHMTDSANVLSGIERLQAALKTEDKTSVLAVFEEIGYMATLDIMRICYPQLAMSYFEKRAQQYLYERQKVSPHLLLKEYIKTTPYRGPSRKFYYTILEKLEDETAEFNAELITGNQQELLLDKDTYVMFYYQGNNLCSCKLKFIGSSQLKQECKNFCINYAMTPDGTLDVTKASAASVTLMNCFSILFDELDIYVESVSQLCASDVRLLLSYLIQTTSFAYVSIKKQMQLLGKLYSFTTSIENSNSSSPFFKLKFSYRESNHTTPISKEAKQCIWKALVTAPSVFRIGTQIAFATGMRSGSFDNLTLSSLVVSQGHYAIRCFLKKTYKHRIKSGLPVYNDYQISDDLAFEIKSFIEQTKALRAQLPKPYLLVYQGDGRRIDTHLAPMVLTGRALSFYLCSVLEKEGVRDDDGIIGRESLRSIRAEMGRMLFAKGKTAKEVSAYLGNSPEVAAKSYNQCYPIDEARKYNDFYKETLERTALLSNSVATKEQSRLVMFGTCLSYKGCNGKDCRLCPERIVPKGGQLV